MQQKLITFAVPCYNSAAYMRHCIETLLSAGEQAEIILVDDPDPGVFPGIAVADFARGVLAAVVDKQDFVILETLLQQAVQAGAQVGFHVVNRNDDGDEHLCRGKG